MSTSTQTIGFELVSFDDEIDFTVLPIANAPKQLDVNVNIFRRNNNQIVYTGFTILYIDKS